MTDATIGLGVTIGIGDGASPTTYATVGEILSWSGPSGTANVIDVSNLDSGSREKIVGLRDEGQVSFSMNMLPGNANQTRLRTIRDAKTLESFQITLTDSGSTVVSFNAYCTEFQISGDVDSQISADVTLEISGPVTWT